MAFSAIQGTGIPQDGRPYQLYLASACAGGPAWLPGAAAFHPRQFQRLGTGAARLGWLGWLDPAKIWR